MAKKNSAGIVFYRCRGESMEVLLVHPGGPFWAKKDAGAWSIPKGEFENGEDPLVAARREFHEETGFTVDGEFTALAPVEQSRGKSVYAWAVQGDCEPADISSNTFSLEWPPRSGKQRQFPEVDRAEWFGVNAAKEKILRGQIGLIEELQRRIECRSSGGNTARQSMPRP